MKNLLDLISVLFVSVCIGVISYICGYTKGYNEAKESYTTYYNELRRIEKETYEMKIKLYDSKEEEK